jgi:thymidylate synthase (FAD)
MAETQMNVTLIAHTQMETGFWHYIVDEHPDMAHVADGALVALTSIRTCYSPLRPTEIVRVEGDKYFKREATDGKGGTDAERLFRHIVSSGHTSTLEHLTFTFAIEGVSRALLAQLTRHRVGFSYSVQSQRYVKFGSNDKSGGFDYVVPESIKQKTIDAMKALGPDITETPDEIYVDVMQYLQNAYDTLRKYGIPAEDARAVLPNATATNLVMTVNLRALLDFYSKRRKGRGAQAEIAELAERLRECVVEVEPWTDQFFEVA